MLSTLIANIQDAIVVLDASGKVIFESPSASAILGIDPDDVLGSFGLQRIHPDERAAVIESFERTRAVAGAVARATYRFQRGDGSWQYFEALAKNLLDDPVLSGVLITFRDVTDRIRAIEAAEQAGRARDEFLSRMSHEFRTPLHAILGWAQLLLQTGPAESREAAEQIVAAGHHLLRLVDDALDLAAVQEGRIAIAPRPVSIGVVVSEALDLVQPLARQRDIQIRILSPCPEDARVTADPDRLRQILINLLSNAVKYNRYAGEVGISWRKAEGAPWRISVRDTGPGISEGMLPRLFERYERLEAKYSGVEGSGLGLAIASRLVEMMEGAIGVESTPGEGSTFWIDLPAAASARGGSGPSRTEGLRAPDDRPPNSTKPSPESLVTS